MRAGRVTTGWASDGMMFSVYPRRGCRRRWLAGGAGEPVEPPEAVGVAHTRVDVLPNGKGVFIAIEKESANTGEIGVLELATGKVKWYFLEVSRLDLQHPSAGG